MVRVHWVVAFSVAVATAGLSSTALGNTYYIATDGSDSYDGSIGSPFATFNKAISVVSAGDTIYVRGGTFNLSSRISISKSGTSDDPISLLAYPGETPVLNFSSMSSSLLGQSSGRGVQFNSSGNWWNVQGLTIENAKDNGLYSEGYNNVFEQLVLRYNADSGLQLSGNATNNLVLNTDSYENYDPHNHGENADGFAAKFENLGPGNVFRGDRAWGNSDDGWDFWEAASGVTVEDCWSFKNGINIWGDSSFAGDGNGIKLGHDSGTHYLRNMLVWDNPANGVDVNGNATQLEDPPNVIDHGVEVYNVTSYSNGDRNFRFDEEYPHVLRNNVSLDGSVTIYGSVDDAYNTWNGISVDASDFLSLSDAGTTGPRQADGSLPLIDYLRLAPGSHLIDAGVDVGLSYNGDAPDLGAFETGIAPPELPGDYNNDGRVDAADYTVWRDHLNTSFTMFNDETPGSVTPDDLTVWREHFGESTGSGSLTLGAAAVPEPVSAILLVVGAAVARAVLRRKRGQPAA